MMALLRYMVSWRKLEILKTCTELVCFVLILIKLSVAFFSDLVLLVYRNEAVSAITGRARLNYSRCMLILVTTMMQDGYGGMN